MLVVTAAAALAKWSFWRQRWRAGRNSLGHQQFGFAVCFCLVLAAPLYLLFPWLWCTSFLEILWAASLSSTSFCVGQSVPGFAVYHLDSLPSAGFVIISLYCYNLIKDKVVCVGADHRMPMEDERLKIKANILSYNIFQEYDKVIWWIRMVCGLWLLLNLWCGPSLISCWLNRRRGKPNTRSDSVSSEFFQGGGRLFFPC